ncbi:iron-sulfur cluster biosynthesis family protein [Lacticaseibacillus zhaodongensis]|uniref:iron-sulfur cluster biosynthesis family protein n=1 Tax=Lacticaseibacillus zhaodongensis TaxID=2668065 RepID=UPI0012D30CEC|nr:iron-sulfur cluster biosynthesis family protein [Lacticaseibacillus zhaodongensis]
MQLTFDEASINKIKPHLGDGKRLLLTFEDGVGPYSQHAMLHMMVQFTINVVAADADVHDYDYTIDSNLGPVGLKGYSQEDLDEHLNIRFNPRENALVLSGDIGVIDTNVGFIDFTQADGLKNNPAQ